MNNDNHEDEAESVPPADPVVAGETYIHWKHGREYVVQTVAMGNSLPLIGIDVVVYRVVEAEPGDKSYVRTREDFTACVTRDDGKVVRRFRLKPKAAPPGGDGQAPELVRVRVRHYAEVDGYFVVEKAKWESMSAEARQEEIDVFCSDGDLYVDLESSEPGDRAGDAVYDEDEEDADGVEEAG